MSGKPVFTSDHILEANTTFNFILAKYLSHVRDSLLINAGYLFGIEVLNSLAGFLFWGIAARLYAPEAIGLAAAVIAAAALVNSLAGLGIDTGIVRFLPASPAPQRLMNSALGFVSLTAALVGLAYLAGIPLWSPNLSILRDSWPTALVFLAYCLVLSISLPVRMFFIARRQAIYPLISSGILNFFRLILILLLASLGFMGLVGSIILAAAVTLAANLAIFMPRVESDYKPHFEYRWAAISGILPYSFANYISSLLLRAPQTILPLLVLEKLGPAATGHAYIAWMVGAFVAAPGVSLASSAFAEGSNITEKTTSIFTKSILLSLAVTLLACVVLLIGAPLLLSFFGPSYQRQSLELLRWLALAAPLAVVTTQYFAYLRVRKRVRGLMFLSGALALITLGISYVFLPRLGIQANGIAWLCANGFVAAVAGFYAVKTARNLIRQKIRDVLDLRNHINRSDELG